MKSTILLRITFRYSGTYHVDRLLVLWIQPNKELIPRLLFFDV